MKYFEYAVTTVLLILAGLFKSPAFAYAAVLSLLSNMAREAMEKKLLSMKDINVHIPDDLKKKIENLEIRTASIEYGIKARGF